MLVTTADTVKDGQTSSTTNSSNKHRRPILSYDIGASVNKQNSLKTPLIACVKALAELLFYLRRFALSLCGFLQESHILLYLG